MEKSKRRKRCSLCRKLKDDVARRVDPYQEEIYGIREEKNLCDECYQLCMDEV